MIYAKYEQIMSAKRLTRYKKACRDNKGRAVELYWRNILLSEAMLGVICMFEIALRNAIDRYYSRTFGEDWLLDSSRDGGRFDNNNCKGTKNIIMYAYNKRYEDHPELYKKEDLLSDCEFGIWRYMFARHQYSAFEGANLIEIFPKRPKRVNDKIVCDRQFFYRELTKINRLRNRIAHHEPICFREKQSIIESRQVKYVHRQIRTFLMWMDIDSVDLLHEIDHVLDACGKIDEIAILTQDKK